MAGEAHTDTAPSIPTAPSILVMQCAYLLLDFVKLPYPIVSCEPSMCLFSSFVCVMPVDYLPLHNLPADMFRMCVCIMELVTVTAGANGCDALLGWWAPPPLPPRAPRFAHPPPPPPPRRDVKREEDDALAAAADAADFAAAATARAFRADGSPQRGGWRADREPSARAAGAAGGDDDTGQDGSSPRVKSEGGGGGVKREPRDSDTHGENAEDHHGDGDGDAQGACSARLSASANLLLAHFHGGQ